MEQYITISKFLYDFNSNSLNENRYELNKKIINTAKRLENLHFFHSKKILKESYKTFITSTKKNIFLRNRIKSRNHDLYEFLKEIRNKRYNIADFSNDLKNLSLSDSRESFKICGIEFPITLKKNLNENLLISQTKKVEGLFEIFDTLKKGWDLVVGGFKRVFRLIELVWTLIKNFRKVTDPSNKSVIQKAINDSLKKAQDIKREIKNDPSLGTPSAAERLVIDKILTHTTNLDNTHKLIKNRAAIASPNSLLQTLSKSAKVNPDEFSQPVSQNLDNHEPKDITQLSETKKNKLNKFKKLLKETSSAASGYGSWSGEELQPFKIYTEQEIRAMWEEKKSKGEISDISENEYQKFKQEMEKVNAQTNNTKLQQLDIIEDYKTPNGQEKLTLKVFGQKAKEILKAVGQAAYEGLIIVKDFLIALGKFLYYKIAPDLLIAAEEHEEILTLGYWWDRIVNDKDSISKQEIERIVKSRQEESYKKLVDVLTPVAEKHPYIFSAMYAINRYTRIVFDNTIGRLFGLKRGEKDSLLSGQEGYWKDLQNASLAKNTEITTKIGIFFTTYPIEIAIGAAVAYLLVKLGFWIWNWRLRVSRTPKILSRFRMKNNNILTRS